MGKWSVPSKFMWFSGLLICSFVLQRRRSLDKLYIMWDKWEEKPWHFSTSLTNNHHQAVITPASFHFNLPSPPSPLKSSRFLSCHIRRYINLSKWQSAVTRFCFISFRFCPGCGRYLLYQLHTTDSWARPSYADCHNYCDIIAPFNECIIKKRLNGFLSQEEQTGGAIIRYESMGWLPSNLNN